MSNDIILKVENLSKQYQLGTFGTRTIGGDVHRWWMTKVRGKEDPFLQVGQVNDRTSKEKADFVWALKDINFEVKRGEVLGIIGKNGAGKSTLLKLLSRVTSPTTGIIKSKGRMASLLEVGTGFHPELTGLENIYLNGAILGMTKAEIKRKLDEIIDFSGCAMYIDTPVKRYSSGMKVRLGFAVAAFLDPEILIVDEVLAVGDAEFQKKAIGKMQDVSKGEGRTVLFVSHNMASVQKLCNNGIIIKNGKIINTGFIDDVVEEYLKLNFENKNPKITFKDCGKEVYYRSVVLKNSDGLNTSQIKFGEPFEVELKIKSNIDKDIIEPLIAINTINDVRVFTAISSDQHMSYKFYKGEDKTIRVKFDTVLTPGNYKIILDIRSGRYTSFDLKFDVLNFQVSQKTFRDTVPNEKILGLIREYPKWI